LSVGRTGKITPNARLKPVMIDGSLVSFATLHNEDYINLLNLKISDKVIVVKAGDVIPRVKKVIFSKPDAIAYTFPKKCPSCQQLIIRYEADYFCKNDLCGGRIIQRISHFASRRALNIDGLSEGIISRLYEKGELKSFSDLYRISYDDIINIEGFADKSAKNLIHAIKDSLMTTIESFIFGLGIKQVGFENAKLITNKFSSIKELYGATKESLVMIDGIGESIADEVIDYLKKFSDEINELLNFGFIFSAKEIISNDFYTNLFLDKKVLITGSFKSFKRDDLKKIITDNGGRSVTSISSNTDLLISGSDPGSKYTKAIELGIKIISENDLGVN